MVIVLVSSNPLFAEMLSNTFRQAVRARVVQVTPDAAPKRIKADRPAVVLVDEGGICPEVLSDLLAVTRKLPDSCTILLNLQNNDVTVVNAHRATVRKVEDIVNTIRAIEEKHHNGHSRESVPAEPGAAAAARAGAYGFLALLCNQRPRLDLVHRLRAVGVEGFLGLVDEESAGELVRQGLHEMADFVAQAGEQSDAELEERLAVDWTRLFRGVHPGYGPPPPYEGVYLGGDPLRAIQAMARVYREYGVEPAEDTGNRPDYLGLELAFLQHLCEQQAEAYEKGDEEGIDRWTRAEETFFKQHLGRWASTYCDRAIAEAKTGFYRGAAQLIKGMLEEEIDMQHTVTIHEDF